MRRDDNDKDYIYVCGKILYIDFDEILSNIMFSVEPVTSNDDIDNETDLSLPPTFNITKWDMISRLLDVITIAGEEEDPKMGESNLDKLPIGFKIAYNTLLKYNIIKTIE